MRKPSRKSPKTLSQRGRGRARFDPAVVASSLEAFQRIRARLALVLGSGFHGMRDQVEVVAEQDYTRIPGFHPTSVEGHKGCLLAGRLGGVPVLLLCGRAHFYEGHPLESVTFPIRVLAELGIRHLLLTNAAGAINRRYRPGDFMLLKDHINFMGASPLRGPGRPGGDPFVDLSRVYDPAMRAGLKRAARRMGLPLHEGVYLAVSGPNYETPAEIRAFAKWGADAVGMSTVPEAIVARQCGLGVAGLSCLTNLAAGRQAGPLSHREVLETATRVKENACRLLGEYVALYGNES